MAVACASLIVTAATIFGGEGQPPKFLFGEGQPRKFSNSLSVDARDRHDPSELERNQLRIEWEKPRVVSNEIVRQEIVVSGTLRLESSDGKSSRPINWVQPILIGIARRHDINANFDKGLSKTDFAVAPVIALPSRGGAFSASFPLQEIVRSVGVDREFAVAASLGTMNEDTAWWRDDAAVIKGTIGAVKIPGQPRLNPTVAKINGCLDDHGWDFDPKLAIRAVNDLRRLGRRDAIKTLEEYCALAGSKERFTSFRNNRRVAEEIDTANPSSLLFLVELVFTPPRQPLSGDPAVVVCRDIPFHRFYYPGFIHTGPAFDYGECIDRAKKHDGFLGKPLLPPDAPLDVADKFIVEVIHWQKSKYRRLDTADTTRHIRRQAIRLIKSDATLKAIPSLDEKLADTDANWDVLKLEAAKLRLRWDEANEEYRPAAAIASAVRE